MKTKSYKATFFRHNPQFKNGGYVTERKIEAVALPSARKRAREIAEHCVYAVSYTHLDVYKRQRFAAQKALTKGTPGCLRRGEGTSAEV